MRLAQVQAGFRRQSDCASKAEGGGNAPHGLRRHPGSSRGLLLGSFTFPGGGRWTRSTAIARPFAFQTTPATLAGSSSNAESGEIESHGLRRALVSSVARRLAGSLSMREVFTFESELRKRARILPLPTG